MRALGRGRVFDSFGLVAGVTGTTEKGTEKVEDVLTKDARFARSKRTLRYRVCSSDEKEEVGVIWSSEDEFAGDALELSGDEGRGKLRKATGRSKHP